MEDKKTKTKNENVKGQNKNNNIIKEKVNSEENLKKEIEKLTKEILDLNFKMISLEQENKKNILDFQNKAKTFEEKAQNEINKYKSTFLEKYEEEKKEFKKYGSQKLIESIIDPILNIELAIKIGSNQDDAIASYVKGFEMLIEQLNIELESFGIVRIVPKIGSDFDPKLHWAITSKNGENKNKIVEVKKNGYKLHDRIIKPATVVIEN